MPDLPHFAFPFRWIAQPDGSVAAAAVEQDSVDEVAMCVEILLRTPLGFRADDGMPDFGTPEILFDLAPLNLDQLKESLAEWEPRAAARFAEYGDVVDETIRNVRIDLEESERF